MTPFSANTIRASRDEEFEQKHAKPAKVGAASRRTHGFSWKSKSYESQLFSAKRTPTPSRSLRASVHISFFTLLVSSLMLTLSACGRQDTSPATESPGQPRVEVTSQGDVSVTFTFDPPAVRLDRDVLLTISINAPTNLTVKLPPIEDRVKGFVVSGTFDAPVTVSGANSLRRRNIRLTPQVSTLYRIAPMAVTWPEPGTGRELWFPTKPVVLDSEPLVKGDPGKDIAAARGPVWIYPGLKGFLGYLMAALGLAAVGYGVWRLFMKLRRAVRLRLMSPRERALFELAELLAKGLPAPDHVKEFYFGLTLIIRAYIERAHAIRAPEQTTEEFLEAVSRDTRFAPETVKRLREFMKAADLVKYAAFRPDPASVDHAVGTAKQYIETDAPEKET